MWEISALENDLYDLLFLDIMNMLQSVSDLALMSLGFET